MLKILLALVIITILFYMNPLNKMDSSTLDEKKKSNVERQVDEVQKQVDYAKKMVEQEYNEVNKR